VFSASDNSLKESNNLQATFDECPGTYKEGIYKWGNKGAGRGGREGGMEGWRSHIILLLLSCMWWVVI
jgi:hypothetical protein